MKTLRDPGHALGIGLTEIRQQFQLPNGFPDDTLAAAEAARDRIPAEHVDRTAMNFVTLDPATSTDLDQAFAIERSGQDYLLHYAIADVAWFVREGDPLDEEAWKRGASQYLPDGKVPLYPAAIGEAAASLLPDGPRPAIIFTSRIGSEGEATLQGVERALIRSRAKLAYATVEEMDLPAGFAEISTRIRLAEYKRGASRVDPPEQEVEPLGNGGYTLRFRNRYASEDQNASLSLATNLAIAKALLKHHVGFFRIMPEPDAKAIERLRQTARAFGLQWPCMASLSQYERTLDPTDPKQAAFMMAIRRAGERATYAPYEEGMMPWHAAIAAPYVHATAPLRRLADRYVIQAALAVANGQPVPLDVRQAFERLQPVMDRANGLGGQIERAVIGLAEALMLQGHTGEIFNALVTDVDERGARIQLCDAPVVDRIDVDGLEPGSEVKVRLTQIDTVKRRIAFEQA